MHPTSLSLNIVPLDLPESKAFSFHHSQPVDIFTIPLNTYEMPKSIADSHNDAIYSDLTGEHTGDTEVVIQFGESPKFAGNYLTNKLHRFFADKARLRRRNYIGNSELYFPVGEPQNRIATFDRFVLRGSYSRITVGFEMTVMYRGTMKVWMKPIYEYPGADTDFKKVVYKKEVWKYDDVMEIPGVDRKKVWPVINRSLANELSLPTPHYNSRPINKIKRHSEKIDWFYEQLLTRDDFKEQFRPKTDGYYRLKKSEVHRLQPSSANLLFGNGVVHKNPYFGLYKGGPYDPPKASHIELFIIVAEDDAKKYGNKLYNILKEGQGSYSGFNSYARTPFTQSDHHITFKNKENPFPEIKAQLEEMQLDENIQYGALYISPIHKDDPDPEKHRVYYRVKEELLKYKITSQVIDSESIADPSFSSYLPNISTALIAKLDGIPWTLEQKSRKELIIGVSAYKPKKSQKRYLGSAICFTNNGTFQGFNSFSEDDTLKLAGSFHKAIKTYKEENENVERVVIHFYKKMSRREAKVIKKVLKSLDLDIPIVVLTIHKSRSTDYVLTDTEVDHLMPLSGTWIKSGKTQFLICNNTRFDHPKDKINSYPFPLKVYIEPGREENQTDEEYETMFIEKLENKEWIEPLLEQVYQFSRLNWHTVRTGNMPITVNYPEKIAEKSPHFNGDNIPEFGLYNFWFL